MARGKTQRTGKGSQGQNRAQGLAFLEKQRQKAGVIQCDSGLLYEIMRDGDDGDDSGDSDDRTGASAVFPGADATVRIHYRVRVASGNVFSDTYQKAAPRTYLLSDVIDGLSEGIQLMRVGSKHRLIIPPECAWGSTGSGEHIGPHAVVVWTVELLEILSD